MSVIPVTAVQKKSHEGLQSRRGNSTRSDLLKTSELISGFAISTSKARLLVTAITSGACPKRTHDLRLIVQTRPTQRPAEMKDVTEGVETEKGGI